MSNIPKDISTAPSWLVLAYVSEFNKLMVTGLNDPDRDARQQCQNLWDSAVVKIGNPKDR